MYKIIGKCKDNCSSYERDTNENWIFQESVIDPESAGISTTEVYLSHLMN